MATIYELDNQIIRVCATDTEEEDFGAPDNYDYLLAFDAETNSELLYRLNTDWNNHSMSKGVLYYLGQPVVINPPGEHYQDRQYLLGWWTKLNTALDNTDAALALTEQAAETWVTLTKQQKQAWLVDHFDEVLSGLALVLRIQHGIPRFIRWLIKRLDAG